MMINKNMAIALIAASSWFGLTSTAFAGEGGAAGAASFTVSGTGVTGVAVAASVGKNDAAAAAYNTTAGYNSAFAMGSSGLIMMTQAGDPTTASMAGSVDPSLGTAQANTLTNGGSVQIGTSTGNPVATLSK